MTKIFENISEYNKIKIIEMTRILKTTRNIIFSNNIIFFSIFSLLFCYNIVHFVLKYRSFCSARRRVYTGKVCNTIAEGKHLRILTATIISFF